MIKFAVILLSTCYSADIDYADSGSAERLQEVILDESGGMHFLKMKDTHQIDLEIIEDVNQQVRQIAQDIQILAEIQELIGVQISQDGEKLDVAEVQVDNTLVQVIDTVQILTEAEKIQNQNIFLSLFLKGGVPLSAGAGVGTAGFFATKAAVIGIAPFLTSTAAPIIIPAALAVVAGGTALFGSRFVLSKIV